MFFFFFSVAATLESLHTRLKQSLLSSFARRGLGGTLFPVRAACLPTKMSCARVCDASIAAAAASRSVSLKVACRETGGQLRGGRPFGLPLAASDRMSREPE